MASSGRSSSVLNSSSEQVLLMLLSSFLCGFLAYSIYDAVMAAAANLMQRFLIISPMLILIAVHCLYLSSSSSSPQVHQGFGSSGSAAWGGVSVSLVLLVIVSLVIISYAPVFNFWSCVLFQVFIGLALTI